MRELLFVVVAMSLCGVVSSVFAMGPSPAQCQELIAKCPANPTTAYPKCYKYLAGCKAQAAQKSN